MEMLLHFFQKKAVKRFLILFLIGLSLYFVRSMINLILFTFIFSYLMDRLVQFFTSKFAIKRSIAVILLYFTVLFLLIYGISTYLPVVIQQISILVIQITDFYMQPHDNAVLNFIVNTINNLNVTTYLHQGFTFIFKYFTNIWGNLLQVFMAIVLSLFFLLEKDRLRLFATRFHTSKIAPIYFECKYFCKKFVATFGKVIEAQFIIAIINCVLTTTSLYFLGFPQLFGLGIMIFLLGLIPVAGVIISFIPLCIIGYTVGGITHVISIVILIVVIHALEAYILNPKLMSSKTDLPVFFTFIVLIFSEHFFGVWGLIVGIPIFIFLLDILEVKSEKQRKESIKEK
ncbi:AI-2E family transporter [Niallia circulans]|jgi:predicted PurR-regulated permease PerM|uniref:AI-2E family transporter n=1 Tax=Niallia TaxID=2837506 RepID=UPI00077C9E90|nr:AI-2E family transporter [Niallia circulans]MDR4317508.1 AI-2E family transporter [Niallia circulans]MED3840581.1 AI-2E family transporter [Niallia circulans]MED4243585.1 AI-2E family transporter [Niallia circulans]MED4247454.1 AI-2E family transporter [Niallia circulans]NRG34944.1 AI-2E family transporter [Niallia circulans]